MPIGTKKDFKIYDEQYYGGMWEGVTQSVNAFNGSSAGAIVLTTRDVLGDFSKESFIKQMSIVSRRDPNLTGNVEDAAIMHGEFVSVKLSRRIGPVAQTIDSWRKINQDPEQMSFLLGQMAGEQQVQEYLNTALLALTTTIGGVDALNPKVNGGLSHSNLVTLMSALGDQSASMVAFVMHSKPYFDLIKDALVEKVVEVAGATIYSGTVATFNKPTIVTDSPSLVVTGEPAKYKVLGLVPNAVKVEENSDKQTVAFQLITGQENLVYRYQAEYAFNLGVRGFAWKTTAGENPNDATLGSTENWTQEASDIKSLAGAMITVE